MGRNYSWTARVGGKVIADGTTAGGDDYTPQRVEREATDNVALRAKVRPDAVSVDVTERESTRKGR